MASPLFRSGEGCYGPPGSGQGCQHARDRLWREGAAPAQVTYRRASRCGWQGSEEPLASYTGHRRSPDMGVSARCVGSLFHKAGLQNHWRKLDCRCVTRRYPRCLKNQETHSRQEVRVSSDEASYRDTVPAEAFRRLDVVMPASGTGYAVDALMRCIAKRDVTFLRGIASISRL